MQTPLQITFRHMPKSPALEERVREHVGHLARFHDHIIGCKVILGAPAGRHQSGAPFEVRVNVSVPDGDLHANNERSATAAHADVYVAVRDAFDALERMLRKQTHLRHRARERESIRRGIAGRGNP